jgi:hypothetical protein
MGTFKVIVLAVASTLPVTAAASAADLFTPPLLFSVTANDDSASCEIVNVSAQSRTVSIELSNESGLVVLQGGQAIVAPEHVVAAGAGGPQVGDILALPSE